MLRSAHRSRDDDVVEISVARALALIPHRRLGARMVHDLGRSVCCRTLFAGIEEAGLPYGSLEKPKLRLEKTVSKSVSCERGKTRVHITFRSHLPELGMVKVALPL